MKKVISIMVYCLMVMCVSVGIQANSFAINDDFQKYEDAKLPFNVEYKDNVYIVMKQANETVVIWTENSLDENEKSLLEEYVKQKDPSTKKRTIVFISGFGKYHDIGKNYGKLEVAKNECIVITSDKGSYSHFDVGTYMKDVEEPKEPNIPEEPNTPDTPQEPSNPDIPEEPKEPEEPTPPTEPNQPNIPQEPELPEQLDKPTNPDKPDLPNVVVDTDEPTVENVEYEAPSTSDNSKLSLYLHTGLISLVGIVIVCKKRRREF